MSPPEPSQYPKASTPYSSSKQPQLLKHTLNELALEGVADKKEEPRLPQDVINIILRQVDIPDFLWTTCRNVSHAFRQEVELILKKTWLRDTTVTWPRDELDWSDFYNCRWSRLSDDGLTAYFSVYSSWNGVETRVSLADEDSADSRELQGLITAHISQSTTIEYTESLHVVTRIGADDNDTYFTDAPVPSVVLHGATSEISLDWRALFTTTFRDVQYLRHHKTVTGLDRPHKHHLNVEYPIVITPRHLEFDPRLDFTPCLAVFYRRALELGWLRKARGGAFAMAEWERLLIDNAVHRLEAFSCRVRIEAIVERIDALAANCRGDLCLVQDPAQNGWTRNHHRRRSNDWFNHAWEDPRDGGRTTWSEDVFVIEVERLARAWEKGMA